MMNYDQQIELPEDTFHLFRDIVYNHSGVVLDEGSKYFVENRLQQSIRRRQFDNFRDYYYFLKQDEHFKNILEGKEEDYFKNLAEYKKKVTDALKQEIVKRARTAYDQEKKKAEEEEKERK